MFPHQQPHAVVSDPAGGTGDGRRLHSAAPTSGPPSALLHCLTFTHSCTHSHTDCGVSPDDHGTNQGLSKDYGDPGAPGGPLTSAGGGSPHVSWGGGPNVS